MATLAVLAGAFIGLGANYSIVVTAGGGLAPGVARLLGGVVFSLGLVLVVVAGAELFTGNTLLVMAYASRRITTRALLRAWAVVYAGNFVGAAGTALLVFWSGEHTQRDGQVARRVLEIAEAKGSLAFGRAVVLGILANVLVCLAVWLCFAARSVTDKVLAIVFPVSAFVAAGFEHSIANMFFLPLALLVRHDTAWPATPLDERTLTHVVPSDMVFGNLVPVTIGNIVGGSVFVGLVYWFVFRCRPRRHASDVLHEPDVPNEPDAG
jgi:formate/nitrite transporter